MFIKIMQKKIDILVKDLENHSFKNNILSFILFGSNFVNNNTNYKPDDVDICIVCKKGADVKSIGEFVFKHFEKPDFRIYFDYELESKLNFVDVGNGSFALEYFASGVCVYGKNVFEGMLTKADKTLMKNGYLNKIFEYILRIRVAYISKNKDNIYKLWHLNKYNVRISIDMLLYLDIIEYKDLKELDKEKLFDTCKKYNVLKSDFIYNFEDIDTMFSMFEDISVNFINILNKK